MNHIAVHVRQPKIAATIAKGESLVIHTKQVERRCPHDVDCATIFDHVITVLVGRFVNRSTLDTAAGHPDRETKGIVIASVPSLRKLGPSKFTCKNDQRLVQQTA